MKIHNLKRIKKYFFITFLKKLIFFYEILKKLGLVSRKKPLINYTLIVIVDCLLLNHFFLNKSAKGGIFSIFRSILLSFNSCTMLSILKGCLV